MSGPNPIFDVRRLSTEQRHAMALRIQIAQDFALPELRFWNGQPCRKHRVWTETYLDPTTDDFAERTVRDRPKPGCRDCGIRFRKHQRVGIGWSYMKGRCLIADSVGSGKTAQIAGLVAILKETGEIEESGRVVIVPRPAALYQWHTELTRLIPFVNVAMVDGAKHPKAKRIERYSEPWDVLLLGPQILHNDYELLVSHFDFSLLVTDDVDALRNRDTKTSVTLKKFGRNCSRMVVVTGTPLQKRIQEMHSILDPIGGLEIFGSERSFVNRYTRQRPVQIYARGGRKVTKMETVGYKNVGEFVEKMAPLVLRRTASDIEDVNLPIIMPPNNIYLDLYPAQRAKYEELQAGVLAIMKQTGTTITHIQASTSVHSAAMICGGLSVLGEPDGPGTSVKLDWVEQQLTDGDLSEEKVVVFVRYLRGMRSLAARLERAGIGHVTISGDDADKAARARATERFWSDDSCRVLIGTSAIEQSLNFQCARHLVNIDMIPNPARMEQLVGRIRRDGSAFPHVYVHNLLTVDTHEMRLLPKLEVEQALIDNVWSSKSELFQSLSPMQLMQLIIS